MKKEKDAISDKFVLIIPIIVHYFAYIKLMELKIWDKYRNKTTHRATLTLEMRKGINANAVAIVAAKQMMLMNAVAAENVTVSNTNCILCLVLGRYINE